MRFRLLLWTVLFWGQQGLAADYGLRQPENWQDLAPFKSLQDDKVRIPSDFDWRRMIGNGLQVIRNQQSCGSCWAFATTAVVESLHILKHGYSDIDLAEQTLVSSCSNSGSCQGGYFDAFDYIERNGLPEEHEDPYRARNTSCKRNLTPSVKVDSWAYVGERNRSPTIDELKKAIYKYGPIAVDVYAEFGNYNGGVYENCRRGQTNHMVVLEGWDDEGEYWIMRNSWGREWGEDGYMRIKFTDRNGQKCNNIGNVAAYAVLAE